jgi:CRP-like cAMP-binding protein
VHDELYWSEREPVYEHLLSGFEWAGQVARVPPHVARGVDELIEGTPLFEGLSPAQRDALGQTMRHRRVRPGHTVVREGDAADAFYLIAEGELEVFHEPAPDEVIATLTRGDYFGEAAALEGARRSASVRAKTEAQLFELGRADFRTFVRDHVTLADKVAEAKGLIDLLRRMPAFREVPLAQLALMASLMKPVKAAAGEEVVRQGEEGGSMYVIRKGELEVLVDRPDGRTRRVAVLGAGEHFGEIALVERMPRTATVRALVDSEMSALSKEDFDRRIGRSLSALQAIGRISSRRRREIQERSTEYEFSFAPSRTTEPRDGQSRP